MFDLDQPGRYSSGCAEADAGRNSGRRITAPEPLGKSNRP